MRLRRGQPVLQLQSVAENRRIANPFAANSRRPSQAAGPAIIGAGSQLLVFLDVPPHEPELFAGATQTNRLICRHVEEDYKVKLDIFEGPLDLLLYLIRKDEVDIYDISIERITREYMQYLDTFKMLNIDLRSNS